MSYLTGGQQSSLSQTGQNQPLFFEDMNSNQSYLKDRDVGIDTSTAPKLETKYYHSQAGEGFVKNTHPIPKNYSYIQGNYPNKTQQK